MIDREKVIKALECLKEGSYCECCDYKPYDDCVKRVATDALVLLKEQEAVVRCKDCIYGEHEKNESTGMEWIYCTHHRENRPKEWYCASGSPTITQGRSVKWE